MRAWELHAERHYYGSGLIATLTVGTISKEDEVVMPFEAEEGDEITVILTWDDWPTSSAKLRFVSL